MNEICLMNLRFIKLVMGLYVFALTSDQLLNAADQDTSIDAADITSAVVQVSSLFDGNAKNSSTAAKVGAAAQMLREADMPASAEDKQRFVDGVLSLKERVDKAWDSLPDAYKNKTNLGGKKDTDKAEKLDKDLKEPARKSMAEAPVLPVVQTPTVSSPNTSSSPFGSSSMPMPPPVPSVSSPNPLNNPFGGGSMPTPPTPSLSSPNTTSSPFGSSSMPMPPPVPSVSSPNPLNNPFGGGSMPTPPTPSLSSPNTSSSPFGSSSMPTPPTPSGSSSSPLNNPFSGSSTPTPPTPALSSSNTTSSPFGSSSMPTPSASGLTSPEAGLPGLPPKPKPAGIMTQ